MSQNKPAKPEVTQAKEIYPRPLVWPAEHWRFNRFQYNINRIASKARKTISYNGK